MDPNKDSALQLIDLLFDSDIKNRELLSEYEAVLVALRKFAKSLDPTLPEWYDADAWYEIEVKWK